MSTATTCRIARPASISRIAAIQFADGVYEVIAVRRRPSRRRGAASRAPAPLARRAAHRGADARRGAARSSCARWCAAIGVDRRHRLSPGHPRRRAARPRLSRRRQSRLSSSPRGVPTVRRSAARRGGRRASSRSPTSAGSAATSRSVALLPNVSASSGRGRPAPMRPGRSTATAMSPRAPRPTPGS